MQATPTAETLANNPRLLAKCHVGVALTYLILSILGILDSIQSEEASIQSADINIQVIIVLAVFFVLGLIHAALAPACARRSERARRISEFLFSALILAFPVGTLLSIYLFLPATQWQAPATESDAEFEP
ncbi:MAG: hypothetical protein LBR88_10790 [Zoogloeaceae bacterium]|jgi:hypothetical protein|nr:hypothetical protein [Zoogloeaceae bacterium]